MDLKHAHSISFMQISAFLCKELPIMILYFIIDKTCITRLVKTNGVKEGRQIWIICQSIVMN